MATEFLDSFSQEVWSTTYKHHTDNSIDDTLARVAKAVASVEKSEKQEAVEKSFNDLLSGFKMCAGGRIMANAGTGWKGTTLMNCFVGPKAKYDQDSIEGIFEVLLKQVLTLKSEGGWGMNFSFIRPRGSFIHGIGVETPGSVKYMEIFNTTSDVITAGSGKSQKQTKEGKTKIRKGAMMAVLDIWHPDIKEFITAKLQEGRLNKFNLSVNCSNEFMDRVVRIKEINKLIAATPIKDSQHNLDSLNEELGWLEKWELVFPDTKFASYKKEWDGNIELWKSKSYPIKVYETVKVSDLWELIMESTFNRNDPGVLFLDYANETHNWNYGGIEAYIAATNPCGEQTLPFGFVCNLGSMNLTKFVKEDGTFGIDFFAHCVAQAVRFLDNVNDLTDAPLPEYATSIKGKRRIGLGVMGWGSMLYMMKIRFGSKEAEVLKDKIMDVLTGVAVITSVGLAKEKGMFDGCDPIKHSEHIFFKQIGIDEGTLSDMRKYGIRNSALFSCQPTGNTGIVANVVSGGIEPVFAPEYTRTVIVDGCPAELKDLVPKYWEGEHKENEHFKWVNEGTDKILRATIDGVVYKIDKNRGLTREVVCMDYGVRWLKAKGEWNPEAEWAVTANTLSVEDHVNDLKGFGKWIDSSISKTVNVPNDYPYEDFKGIYLSAYQSKLKGITTYRAGTMMNVLTIDKKKNTLQKTSAPKRPKQLNGEIFALNYKKEKLYVAIGFWDDGSPYEVFTGINFRHKIEHTKGKIVKVSRGNYSFIYDDNEEYHLTNGHSDENASALCRILSASLRHGCDISFLVHQLEKTEGDLTSFSKVISRVLKKYIKDGTEVTGESCPTCAGKLIRQEGCCVCPSCGFSKCA